MEIVMDRRDFLKNKKRIVIKIGSSSLMHEETGEIDFIKVEKLVRILSDIKNLIDLPAYGAGSTGNSCPSP